MSTDMRVFLVFYIFLEYNWYIKKKFKLLGKKKPEKNKKYSKTGSHKNWGFCKLFIQVARNSEFIFDFLYPMVLSFKFFDAFRTYE